MGCLSILHMWISKLPSKQQLVVKVNYTCLINNYPQTTISLVSILYMSISKLSSKQQLVVKYIIHVNK